jgi:hypothetical protein
VLIYAIVADAPNLRKGLVYVPADDAWAANTARPRTAAASPTGSQAQVRRDTGAELILIILLLLLVGGIIYATFASNPMSFDDLIELRFLPSRRRHRDPEYFEQLKSITTTRRELPRDW